MAWLTLGMSLVQVFILVVGFLAVDAIQSLTIEKHPRVPKCGVSKGEWGKPENPGSSDLNLCGRGKALPQFIMLAHPKTATGSIASDLVSANFGCAGREKEWDFCAKNRGDFGFDESAYVKEWYAHMPKCSTTERQVLGDFSPKALSMIKEETHFNWPKMLNKIYGPSVNRVVFGVFLRERMARIHSHFYFGRKAANDDLKKSNFRSDLKKAISNKLKNMSVDNGGAVAWWFSVALDLGKYGEQLQAFLGELPARRFIITPVGAYTDNGAELCRHIGKLLSYDMACSDRTAFQNSRRHVSLERDSTPSLREQFDEFFADDHELLLRVLAEAHEKGATLTKHFVKSSTSPSKVRRWLEKYW